jgi:hypothetical protein
MSDRRNMAAHAADENEKRAIQDVSILTMPITTVMGKYGLSHPRAIRCREAIRANLAKTKKGKATLSDLDDEKRLDSVLRTCTNASQAYEGLLEELAKGTFSRAELARRFRLTRERVRQIGNRLDEAAFFLNVSAEDVIQKVATPKKKKK